MEFHKQGMQPGNERRKIRGGEGVTLMPAPLTAATTVAARMSPKVRIVRAIDFEDNYKKILVLTLFFFWHLVLGRLGMEQFLLFEMAPPRE